MMKRGTKRKIEIQIRETKQQRSVACSKRRRTVFSKAADLCRLSGANIAVFVTSPDQNSDVVYSFSGYSSALEIADCYLNGKAPPKVKPQSNSKLGFWWEDPDLYCNCEDLDELDIIGDRLERLKKDMLACLEKKDKLYVQNPKYSSSQVDQNPSFSVEEIKSGSCSSDQPISFFENIGGFWDTKEDQSNTMSLLTQAETQTKSMVNDGESFNWEDLVKYDDVFGFNGDFCFDNNNFQANITDDMIDIGEYLNEEAIDY